MEASTVVTVRVTICSWLCYHLWGKHKIYSKFEKSLIFFEYLYFTTLFGTRWVLFTILPGVEVAPDLLGPSLLFRSSWVSLAMLGSWKPDTVHVHENTERGCERTRQEKNYEGGIYQIYLLQTKPRVSCIYYTIMKQNLTRAWTWSPVSVLISDLSYINHFRAKKCEI